MEPITSDIVERTWQKIGVMDPRQAPELISDLEQSQPIILEYLMAGGEELFNQAERELAVYLGVVIWQIMKEGSPLPSQVVFEDLGRAEQANLKMLKYLGQSTTGDFSQTVESIVLNYGQPEVLRYVVEALYEFEYEGDDEMNDHETEVRPDMKGILFIVLKTIIDCLDQSA